MSRPILFGVDIAGAINQAMGPLMLSATLIRRTPGTRGAGALSAGRTVGDTTTSYPCKGFTEAYKQSYMGGTAERAGGREATLVQVGDRKISLLGASLPDAIDPAPGDQITIEGKTFTIVGDVQRDPVAALFVCQGRL
jgi:hypothetical protein